MQCEKVHNNRSNFLVLSILSLNKMKYLTSLSLAVLSLSLVIAEVANENVSGNSVASENQGKAEHQQLWASDDEDEKKNKHDDSDPGNSGGCSDDECQESVSRALARGVVPLVFQSLTTFVPCATTPVELGYLFPLDRNNRGLVQIGTGIDAKTATITCGGTSANVLNANDVCPTPTPVVEVITVSGQLLTVTVPGVEQIVTATSTVTVTAAAVTSAAACPQQSSDIYVRCVNLVAEVARNAEANAYMADELARQTLEDGCFMVTEWRGDNTSPGVFFRIDPTKAETVAAYRAACAGHGNFMCSTGTTSATDITCPA
jgi:hypothetical protein